MNGLEAKLKFNARGGVAVGIAIGTYVCAPRGYWLAGATLLLACIFYGVAVYRDV